MPSSNLEVFLEAATPQLPWRSAPMDYFQGPDNVWQMEKKDMVDYFTLEDLWEHYSESSAYGLSVPVRLESGKFITQHFVPYLSAIQIYTSKTLAIPRSVGSDETDSWSDDSTAEKLSRSWDDVSDDFDSVPARQGGYLNFQYSEWDPPYERIPLADKVAELAQDYPYLTSLKSAELSPCSWLSVAWVTTVQCDESSRTTASTVALSPFGLATYRMEGKLWTAGSRSQDDLYGAASSWLKQVGAHHPDFNFFTTHTPAAAIRFRY
nr:unnamed protein product [Digitaria exilis]